jgi:hypothetical protein
LAQILGQPCGFHLQAAGLRYGEFGAIHVRQGDWQKASIGDSWIDPQHPEVMLAEQGNKDFVHLHAKVRPARSTARVPA